MHCGVVFFFPVLFFLELVITKHIAILYATANTYTSVTYVFCIFTQVDRRIFKPLLLDFLHSVASYVAILYVHLYVHRCICNFNIRTCSYGCINYFIYRLTGVFINSTRVYQLNCYTMKHTYVYQ